MKTNEIPEKIYIFENPILDFTKLSVRQSDTDIEYIRTDAFIEKAERYIRSVADGLDRDDDVEAFISGFRKYMEGE